MIFTKAFMDILAFHRQGHSMCWIAKKLGIHRDTVKKYIFQKKQPQYRKQKRRESYTFGCDGPGMIEAKGVVFKDGVITSVELSLN